MLLYLVKDFPLKVQRSGRCGEDLGSWAWTTWQTKVEVDLSTENDANGDIPLEFRQAYCRKMSDLLASDGTPMSLTLFLTLDRQTSSKPREMKVRLVGRLLEKLSATWEQPISIVAEIYFRNAEIVPSRADVYRRSSLHPSLRLRPRPVLPHIDNTFDRRVKTTDMSIQPALAMTGSIANQCIANAEPFVEDESAKLNCALDMECDLGIYWRSALSGQMERRAINIELSIYFVVDNDHLTEDRDALEHLSSSNGTILELGLNSDVVIVASNGAKVAAHKCFLTASSSVLATMLSSVYFQESTSNVIKMGDVSEQCVKALLLYLYTFKITDGRNCPIVAVELFQIAHKYDIPGLEKRMAEILQQRPDSWFDVNSACSLFLFAQNFEKYDELKLKALRAIENNQDEIRD